ncbi:rRNA maturation RNase YbeY [Azoarcus olearius]|uniref:Endoribonuclease YbeY n=1 Tax=Azoarcus sp. (strain BH72) TaxID=418699 RepID=YBEY_AZOSB|nr:rRNA maturation RNase YbeY [Azoarcus olearius]A1K3J2.1 RecName: Full=Endoribonuclease YbeY [Azoarcus olearius]CAL93397.1 conserved hypothetical protein [Azoarcus olearius]
MPKQADGVRIVAVDAAGKTSRIKAERLEIDYGDGRRLTLTLPNDGWAHLDIEADVAGDDDGDLPVITIQPSACNAVALRVEVVQQPQVADIDLPVAAKLPVLTLEVQKALDGGDKAAAPKKHQIRRWAQAALRTDAEVTVRLVGETEGRALNLGYRGKDYATNVLTFVYGEEGGAPAVEGMPLMGDLVLCVPVVVREAAEQGKALDAHFAHLVVHGMLHLQGLDHEDDAEAEAMETAETNILRGLGYANPYA